MRVVRFMIGSCRPSGRSIFNSGNSIKTDQKIQSPGVVYLHPFSLTFSHLVASFPATDINNDITIRELGDSLRDDSLAGTERARNRSRSTLNATTRRDEQNCDSQSEKTYGKSASNTR